MAAISESKIKFWTQELIGILNRKLNSLGISSPGSIFEENTRSKWKNDIYAVFPELKDELSTLEKLAEERRVVNDTINETMRSAYAKLGWGAGSICNDPGSLVSTLLRSNLRDKELLLSHYGEKAEEYYKIEEEVRLLPRKLMLASTPDDLKVILEGILSTYNLTLEK
jgi:hypothetical protein